MVTGRRQYEAIEVYLYPFGGFRSEVRSIYGYIRNREGPYKDTTADLRELAAQPLPAQLSDKEKREAERYTKWLKDSSQKLDELENRWHSSLTEMEKNQGPTSKQKQTTEMNQSFNLQYLGLQQAMQDENRRFTLVSNIMKNKHDTAKNAINNIR